MECFQTGTNNGRSPSILLVDLLFATQPPESIDYSFVLEWLLRPFEDTITQRVQEFEPDWDHLLDLIIQCLNGGVSSQLQARVLAHNAIPKLLVWQAEHFPFTPLEAQVHLMRLLKETNDQLNADVLKVMFRYPIIAENATRWCSEFLLRASRCMQTEDYCAMLEIFLDHGANVLDLDPDGDVIWTNAFTFSQATDWDVHAILKTLTLREVPLDYNTTMVDGVDVLTFAARKNWHLTFKFLADRGANVEIEFGTNSTLLSDLLRCQRLISRTSAASYYEVITTIIQRASISYIRRSIADLDWVHEEDLCRLIVSRGIRADVRTLSYPRQTQYVCDHLHFIYDVLEANVSDLLQGKDTAELRDKLNSDAQWDDRFLDLALTPFHLLPRALDAFFDAHSMRSNSFDLKTIHRKLTTKAKQLSLVAHVSACGRRMAEEMAQADTAGYEGGGCEKAQKRPRVEEEKE